VKGQQISSTTAINNSVEEPNTLQYTYHTQALIDKNNHGSERLICNHQNIKQKIVEDARASGGWYMYRL